MRGGIQLQNTTLSELTPETGLLEVPMLHRITNVTDSAPTSVPELLVNGQQIRLSCSHILQWSPSPQHYCHIQAP